MTPAYEDLEDATRRLHLIQHTCDELIARLDDRSYNYGPEFVRADLEYLRACTDPKSTEV